MKPVIIAMTLAVALAAYAILDSYECWMMDDGLNGARGVALGAVLGLVLWAMLFTIGLEVWYLLERWGVRP